jgi:Outer membrane efflux protein
VREVCSRLFECTVMMKVSASCSFLVKPTKMPSSEGDLDREESPCWTSVSGCHQWWTAQLFSSFSRWFSHSFFGELPQVPDLERQLTQLENAISILLGQNPGDIPRGLKLTEQPHAPEVPVGRPSSLLERRPDIREAEQNRIAANAQIGVARSAYFPQISLTGSAGFETPALTSLFTGSAGLWNFGASLTQPIFEGGRIKSNVRFTEAQHDQLLLTDQQLIQESTSRRI